MEGGTILRDTTTDDKFNNTEESGINAAHRIKSPAFHILTVGSHAEWRAVKKAISGNGILNVKLYFAKK